MTFYFNLTALEQKEYEQLQKLMSTDKDKWETDLNRYNVLRSKKNLYLEQIGERPE